PHALKYAFGDAAYDRMSTALGGDPTTASDTQVASYADNYFEYDSFERVSKEIAPGAGASSAGGLGTFNFSYTTSTNPVGFNSWQTKTVETLPDGNQEIVYTNAYAQPMLDVFHETSTGNEWATFNAYDAQGRLVLTALPS